MRSARQFQFWKVLYSLAGLAALAAMIYFLVADDTAGVTLTFTLGVHFRLASLALELEQRGVI